MADIAPPYRSNSQRSTYRQCGTKYLLKYGYGWRPKQDSGRFLFGTVMHQLAEAICRRVVTTEADARAWFESTWGVLDGSKYKWTSRNTYDLFRARGPILAQIMARQIPPVLGPGGATERRIQFSLRPDVTEELTIPDFVGDVTIPTAGPNDRLDLSAGTYHGVIDFKTADRVYDPAKADIDQQLTGQQMAAEAEFKKPVEAVGFCVLLFGTKPGIQWVILPGRSMMEKAHFVNAAAIDDRRILAQEFARNDKQCFTFGMCEYAPLCMESQKHLRDELLEQGDRAQDETFSDDE